MSPLPAISDNKGKFAAAAALAFAVILVSSFAVLYGTDEAYATSYDNVTVGDLVYHLDDMGDSDPDNNTAAVTGVSGAGLLLSEISIPATVTYESVSYSVTEIGSDAFYGCASLTSITMPGSLTGIGDYAFEGCSSLTSVTIPGGVTAMGYRVFAGCTSLSEIVVEDSNTVFSSDEGILYSEDGEWLLICPSGKTGAVTVPEGVENISGEAFDACMSVTSVTMPDSLTSIGYGAFYGCVSLASVTIPENVTSIDGYAFFECFSLRTVTIPAGVASIQPDSFRECVSLISITVDEDNSNYKSVDGVVYSKDGTQLVCCPAGKTGAFSVPDGVTGIGDEAFYFCMFVTSVTIPDSVTSIGDDAFELCVSLTSVTIPDSVTGIGEDAFKGCRSLKSVTIPDSVTTIGEYAF
ncbi:MAG: leucine-rich repeat domain-containing protein, partial [Candidatus Methanomethylophilus sp.]|nr:leucine-rich repeat domain-containing protein [Methanomethylophilus sp.]